MIYIVLGTKAQLIKMAPVMRALQDQKMEYYFIHTGQHKESMKAMYEDFAIKGPDSVLYDGPDITSIKQTFFWFSKLLFAAFWNKQTIFPHNPQKSIVLVHGDTLSTLLGALMGRLSKVRVGHIESGLRSFNLFHPFPEEITRLLVFRLSHTLFCPGSWAIENVKKLHKEKINTGSNTLLDTVRFSEDKPRKLPLQITGPFVLASIHRYENIFKKKQLEKVLEVLQKIASQFKVVFILHPPTKKQLNKYDLYDKVEADPNILCHDRFAHSDFLQILLVAEFIITDGGSLQEETSYLGIPCLLLREATERIEGIGQNVVLSRFDDEIIEKFGGDYKHYRSHNIEKSLSPSGVIANYLEKNWNENDQTRNNAKNSSYLWYI
ncbi:MAG: UDP-N-acetyl glucosamine 2-epimerase [Bacteroidetes bacterium]|nr:UDP-N-acetyl glucosamine 2-epimerase [Bacteroidota bacterium]